jgi:hypothetical protein
MLEVDMDADKMQPIEYSLFRNKIYGFLGEVKNKIGSNEVEYLDEIDDLIERLFDMGKDENNERVTPSREDVDQYWIELEQLVKELSEKYTQVNNYAIKENFAPDYWLWDYEIGLNHGYSEKHKSLFQSKQNPSGRHTYKSKPPQIKWPLTKVVQLGSVTYYIAIVTMNQIDAVATVPSIKKGLSTKYASGRVLNRNLGTNQWQRNLDPQRILKIGKFLDNTENGIANAPMIFAPENDSVIFEKCSEGYYKSITIDFDFLEQDGKDNSLLCDHRGLIDKRPLQIIDGQHRIRGAMRSKRGKELLIPLLIFPPEIEPKGAAKYFAEINTLSEPLNVLHEIHMRHKFQLTSTKAKMDYAPYDGTDNTFRSRANNLAYEAAAYCNQYSDSMESLIKILEENDEKNHIIPADKWVEFSYQWFMPGGPYGPKNDKISTDQEDWFEEITHFFDAFMNLCNTGWEDGKKRWLCYDRLKAKDTGGNRPYIQYKTTIRALMLQLSAVTNKIRNTGYNENIISVERFEAALNPLGNIDWLDRRIKSAFLPKSGGEYAWKCLRQWFSDALYRGELNPYSKQIVMSEEIHSESGKGILSFPKKGDTWFEDPNHKWPTEGKPVRIISKRPINAYDVAEGHLADAEGTRWNESANMKRTKRSHVETRVCTFVVHYGNWAEKCNSAKLTITWGNAIRKEISNVITLEKNRPY